ncbi:hypothetical protein [Chitinimonas sp. BJB300]|uniref:hypothetical protein n=1 Tax=Chitinimonas sp. BJB300 TaxID=1559339 RepID=UPI000C0F6626|nr:hypothetical protein [Chitinimonas sp. BJB300]PHV09794.1 hypothetical protein CSQ89_19730 [Chitinimonas sp. BJB300]TSJ83869.1 hypothetical protein FG002_020285 [Chitinimonas sp. BJB300]
MNLKERPATIFLATTLLMINMSGCEKPNNAASVEAPAPSPSNDYALSPEELKSVTFLAENGDVGAMKKLADFYSIFNEDDEKGLYWLERAGDAGDVNARQFLLGHYAASKQPEKRKYGGELKKRWIQ